MGWAAFWAIFSQTHLVTLILIQTKWRTDNGIPSFQISLCWDEKVCLHMNITFLLRKFVQKA
jgi:hypothetical protein